MRQIPLAIRPLVAPSFDNFVVGDNDWTLTQVRALAPAAMPQSLYLWGPSGVGKTHLLRSLASAWEAGAPCKVCYPSLEHLDPDTAHDLMDQADWSLLILDACELFGEREQQAAFALFVEASSRGAAVAAAGRLPPVDLDLRDDLRTRLGWGLVLPVLPLGDMEAAAVLQAESERRGIVLSDEVVSYLLTRFPRDLKQLMRLLDRLDEFAMSQKRVPTVPLLRQMLLEFPLEP